MNLMKGSQGGQDDCVVKPYDREEIVQLKSKGEKVKMLKSGAPKKEGKMRIRAFPFIGRPKLECIFLLMMSLFIVCAVRGDDAGLLRAE
ncbi:hypothetical protein C0J52_20119 [Blattella germanica]|nr:hypothetical protein C0J52_20119 [Blattella germanica]